MLRQAHAIYLIGCKYLRESIAQVAARFITELACIRIRVTMRHAMALHQFEWPAAQQRPGDRMRVDFTGTADAVDGMDPEMIELARDLRTPLVRFGGNFTSAYHWRDGVATGSCSSGRGNSSMLDR